MVYTLHPSSFYLIYLVDLKSFVLIDVVFASRGGKFWASYCFLVMFFHRKIMLLHTHRVVNIVLRFSSFFLLKLPVWVIHETICEIIEMLMSRSKKSLISLIFCLISRIASPCRHFLKFMLYAVVENASILFTLDYLSESSDFWELDKLFLFYNIANI